MKLWNVQLWIGKEYRVFWIDDHMNKKTETSLGIPCTKAEKRNITNLMKRWIKTIPEPQKTAFKILVTGRRS